MTKERNDSNLDRWLEGCGCLCFWGIAFGTFGFMFSLPGYDSSSPKAKSSAAANIVATNAKECFARKANGEENPVFKIFQLRGYKIFPEDRNCNGDENNLLTAVSEDLSTYPTFSYNVETGEKTCSHNGPAEKLYGCSARKNGEW